MNIKNLTLEQIIHLGVTGNISDKLSVNDWKYLEELLHQPIDEDFEKSLHSSDKLPRAPSGFINLPHDDCEGNLMESLEVCLAQDGDVHLRTNTDSWKHLRFRNSIGGGNYPNTYVALRILYDSMVVDSKGEHQDWVEAVKRYIGE